MSLILSALCVAIYAVVAVLYAMSDRPWLALIWSVGAPVWFFTFMLEVTR